MAGVQATTDRLWHAVIAVVSLVAIAVVLFLVYGPRSVSAADAVIEGVGQIDVAQLPALNALLNACSAALLVAAYLAIRRRRVGLHRALVLAAFGSSVLFLASYLTYHALKEAPLTYAGTLRWLYFGILVSHIILAVTIVPLALLTLYRGWRAAEPNPLPGAIKRHRQLARVTLPIWLYVSITGVAVFLMLRLE